ncbi:MAG TPA: phasin family protein [Pirellulales bacterium]|jgi:hypothetical protein|nr:phasin family protein [Pirellulales bacterium]
MSNAFDSMQGFGKDNMDVAMKAADAVAKGFQTIASEAADYGKRSFEAGTAAFEKMASAKSVDAVVAVQQDYVRTAYQGYIGQVTRFGEIVADMAKTAAAPYQSLYGKFGK